MAESIFLAGTDSLKFTRIARRDPTLLLVPAPGAVEAQDMVELGGFVRDIFKLNEDELVTLSSFYALCGESEVRLRRLCEMFRLRYVVYTEGAVGSTVVCGDGAVSRIPTPHVEVADTVGAGDSFTATFVAMLLQGYTLRESHARAVEVAAEVCTCHGAIMP